MPVAAKLRAEYPDVVFVYLSTDKEQDNWLAATDRLALPGSYRILNPQASRFMSGLQVNTIPRYILIGRDGELLHDRAPGPSGVGELFEQNR